jgi:predicted esterase
MPTRLVGTQRRLLAAPLCALFALAALATAPCSDLLTAPLAAQATTVTRRDLADAYLEVDRIAMRRGLPEDSRLAAWNRDFDRSTIAFFGGDFSRVLRDMHDLLARVTGDSAVASPTRHLLSLRVRGTPRVLVAGRDSHLTVGATVMYTDSTLTAARTLTVRVLDERGRELTGGRMLVPANAVSGHEARLRLDAGAFVQAPGRYTIEATLPGAATPRVTEVFVLAEPAQAIRTRLDRELNGLPPTADQQAVAAVRARIGLIVEQPSESNSAQFVADPAALARQTESEVRALARGQRPFELRVGDHWRVIVGPDGQIPIRVYAPRSVATGARMPVVIALHGAGGDENMFLEGYGNGRLRELADSVDFILLSPATMAFARNPAALDSALAVLEREYVIDRGTVYLLGHSVGGAATIQLASAKSDQVRAAAVIAGAGSVPTGRSLPPTFFQAAEVDLVIPATRVRAAFEQFRAAGYVAEYGQATGWGHTLVVGARLDDVVRWLFAH